VILQCSKHSSRCVIMGLDAHARKLRHTHTHTHACMHHAYTHILRAYTHAHIKMFGMRAAFLDYAHYSTPIDGENMLSIDDKWTSYHGKSTVICCNDKLATQRYNSGIFNFIQHAGLSSVTSIWQHSSSSLFPLSIPPYVPSLWSHHTSKLFST
jgi:hypothetical protein